jgi:hypothetical protein
LALGQSQGPQGFVEATGQCPRRALNVQAKAIVAHAMSEFERRRFGV